MLKMPHVRARVCALVGMAWGRQGAAIAGRTRWVAARGHCVMTPPHDTYRRCRHIMLVVTGTLHENHAANMWDSCGLACNAREGLAYHLCIQAAHLPTLAQRPSPPAVREYYLRNAC